MKIYRESSSKFKKSKGLSFKFKVTIKKITFGTIVFSMLFVSNHALADNKISYNSTNSETGKQTQISIDETNTTTKSAIINSTDEQKKQPEEKVATKVIALSYDDGPSKTLTPQFLKLLKDNESTATFFVLGNKVKSYPDIIKQIHDGGNEIGNHSYDHANLVNLSKEKVQKEISLTNNAIYNITKEYPALVRPPYGSFNNKVKTYINYPLVCWSIDSNDWRNITNEQVINNVMNNLGDGKIILMHDIHKRTLIVSKELITKIKAKGYRIVSISELCKMRDVKFEKGHAYSRVKKQ